MTILLTAKTRLCISSLAAVFLSSCAVSPKPYRPPSPMRPISRSATPKRESPTDQPYEAAEYFVHRRVRDGEQLPMEKYFAAIEHNRWMPLYSTVHRGLRASMKAEVAERGREIALGTWTPLGPANIGGRTRALLIHPTDPNTMYAGAVAGGIWKTTDGGGSWQPLNDLLPNMNIATMAMDPKNPDVIYAGTGESHACPGLRGAGILKTADAGVTWTRLANTIKDEQFAFVNKIVISPNDSRRVYAATWYGVHRSLDSGATWTTVLERPFESDGCQDLVIRADQSTDSIIASCDVTPKTTLFRNIDASRSGKWESVYTEDNMGWTQLALAPSNQNIVYAMAATNEEGQHTKSLLAVYRSTSGGAPNTWVARTRGTDSNKVNANLLTNEHAECIGSSDVYSQGDYDNVLAVDPTNPDRVWAGGIGLFRSEDGGATFGLASYYWTDPSYPGYTHADQHGIFFHPSYNAGSNQTMFVVDDGGIFRTDNALASVAAGGNPFCEPAGVKIKWTSLNNGFASVQFYMGLPYPGATMYLGGAQDNGTNRGADASGSAAWNTVTGGDGGFVAISPDDANIIYTESYNLSLVKSYDGGQNFYDAVKGIDSKDSFPFITVFVMDPQDSATLWLGGTALYRTRNGAVRWSKASPNFGKAGQISAIAVSPADSNTVFAGTENGYIFSNGNALASDSKSDWASTRPRHGYVSAVAFDPTNTNNIYVTYSTFNTSTDDHHIYASQDGGSTWSPIDGSDNQTIPDIPVNTIVVDPTNPSNLYIGTDLGIYVSLDSGAHWMREDSGFPNVLVEYLSLDTFSNPPALFAFTGGRGAWRVWLGGGAAPCSYSVDPPTLSFTATGGGGLFNVTTGDSCTWSVVSETPWILPGGPANIYGPYSLNFTVAANPSASARTGTILVGDQTVTVKQAAARVGANTNDEIATAVAISKLPYTAIHDLRRATSNASDPTHSCTKAADSHTVWFRLTAPSDGLVQADVAGNNSDVDTVLTAYPNGTTPGQQIVCDHRGSASRPDSLIRFSVTSGRAYLIEVSVASNSSPGLVLLNITGMADLAVTAVTADTTGKAAGGALHGSITVGNLGNVDSPPFRVGLYLGTSQTVTTADRFLGYCILDVLPPGSSSTCSGDFGYPALPAGKYFLAGIADDLGAVDDPNRRNNTRVADSGTFTIR